MGCLVFPRRFRFSKSLTNADENFSHPGGAYVCIPAFFVCISAYLRVHTRMSARDRPRRKSYDYIFEIFLIRASGRGGDPILFGTSLPSPSFLLMQHASHWLKTKGWPLSSPPPRASLPGGLRWHLFFQTSKNLWDGLDLRLGIVPLHRGREPDQFFILWFFDRRPRSRDIDCFRNSENSGGGRLDFCRHPYFVNF